MYLTSFFPVSSSTVHSPPTSSIPLLLTSPLLSIVPSLRPSYVRPSVHFHSSILPSIHPSPFPLMPESSSQRNKRCSGSFIGADQSSPASPSLGGRVNGEDAVSVDINLLVRLRQYDNGLDF